MRLGAVSVLTVSRWTGGCVMSQTAMFPSLRRDHVYHFVLTELSCSQDGVLLIKNTPGVSPGSAKLCFISGNVGNNKTIADQLFSNKLT